jgi:hypothetical protein
MATVALVLDMSNHMAALPKVVSLKRIGYLRKKTNQDKIP